jgi:serine phosphatase RsbU (regulator of sigma subunit)
MSGALTVREVMQPNPASVAPGCPVGETLALMNERHIGSVLVTDAGALVGIFTERDLLRRVAGAPADWLARPVAEWMTPNPHTVSPDGSWDEVAALMVRARVRRLPVVADGRVVGIVTAGDLMSRRAEYLNRKLEDGTRDVRRALDELMARDAELTYNLRAAGRLQRRVLLPHAPPPWDELAWGVHYAPLDHLGGDYYDVALPDPDHLGLLVADASGHSIAAALVAILSRFAFAEVSGTASPGEVLSAMNDRLQDLADGRFVTAFYGVLNRRTRAFVYANAGHPYPLRFVAGTGAVEPLAAPGFMLGVVPGERYRDRTVALEPGDRLCFYTDGVVEARNALGEGYGTERLERALAAHGRAGANELTARLLADHTAFRGGHPLNDDVTLVVAELRAS